MLHRRLIEKPTPGLTGSTGQDRDAPARQPLQRHCVEPNVKQRESMRIFTRAKAKPIFSALES